jgi:hypothetical protein
VKGHRKKIAGTLNELADNALAAAAAGGVPGEEKKDGGGVVAGEDGSGGGWKKKWDEVAAWCVKNYQFAPCGHDANTEHLHVGLKDLGRKLKLGDAAASSWTGDDLLALDRYLEKVKEYINRRKRDALQDLDKLKGLQEELEGQYTGTYEKVARDLARDDLGHAAAVEYFAEAQCAMEGNDALYQSMNRLPQLCQAGASVKPEVDKLLARIAEVSASREAFKASPLKNFFRAMEKTAMKLAGDPNLGRADNVR